MNPLTASTRPGASEGGSVPLASQLTQYTPRHTLGEIVRRFGNTLLTTLGTVERRTLEAIAACRTAALGGHVLMCQDCGERTPRYNTCRNRHCPQCQHGLSTRWLNSRLPHLLPTGYFHVVFTLPAELRGLVLANRKELYDLLFAAGTETLQTLAADPKWLGAQLGLTAVLHSWSRDLSFHPHLHCVVTGGGYDVGSGEWRQRSGRFLFPVKVMGQVFRGKFMEGLKDCYYRGKLRFQGGAEGLSEAKKFERLVRQLWQKDWNVYAKAPFAGPEQVYRYLGRYTHRVGLSNARLLEVSSLAVVLRTRGKESVRLTPEELLRRFVLHVLPKGYVKVRHYGLLAGRNVKGRLEQAREALERLQALKDPGHEKRKTPVESTHTMATKSEEKPRHKCPKCGSEKVMVCGLWALEASAEEMERLSKTEGGVNLEGDWVRTRAPTVPGPLGKYRLEVKVAPSE